jgi:hypothetical protein
MATVAARNSAEDQPPVACSRSDGSTPQQQNEQRGRITFDPLAGM